MHVYDFVSKSITEAQVENIVTKAGYNAKDYTYSPRVDHDGCVAQGNTVMSLTSLRNAAKDLKLKVEIVSAIGSEGGSASLSSAAFATPYTVNISMSPDTVQSLLASNYYLYGFKAVQATQGGGAPLVWFQSQTFSTSTVVDWEEQYQAYTSNSQIITNGQIFASNSVDIDLGQILMAGPGGVGPVVNGGPSLAISIQNTTSGPFTCGISQMQNGSSTPLCAFPLFGNNLDVIAPIEKVLLLFSTIPVNTGTVIMQAYGPSILIDLTSDNTRSVDYDINAGWSWGGFNWAQQIAPNSQLVPLLIEPASSTSKIRMVA
ncbi:MAG TPA: hypothetical protein VI669_09415 [Vicinamibacteria bacterium]